VDRHLGHQDHQTSFFKHYVHPPAMPQSLAELWGRISDVTSRVDAATQHRTWEEFQYPLDICRKTHGARRQNIKHFPKRTRVYPKASGLADWRENCKWYNPLPLGAVVSLFCGPV
jgi:hypothetical protein